MKTTVLKLVACLAWMGAAVSSATSADALALTSIGGEYATCSGSYRSATVVACDIYFSYEMRMVLVSESCSSGNCGMLTPWTKTDIVYSYGRKQAAPYFNCGSGTVYELYSCGC
jgi:hypothetical protein